MAWPLVYFSLSSAEKKLIIKAFLLAVRVRILVWVLPPPRLFNKRSALTVGASGVPPASRVLWAVVAVTQRIPFASNCLVRAITAQILLARYGYASDLRIGVTKPQDGKCIKAHAWLEKDGKILIGEETDFSWTPLPAF